MTRDPVSRVTGRGASVIGLRRTTAWRCLPVRCRGGRHRAALRGLGLGSLIRYRHIVLYPVRLLILGRIPDHRHGVGDLGYDADRALRSGYSG
jgi:hypothetical protein